MKTAVIVGGGPAGCQTALWLKLLGFEPLIIEHGSNLGGLQAISPYPNNWIVGTIGLNGNEIARNIEKHIQQLNISVFLNTTIKEIKNIEEGFEIQAKNQIIKTQYLVIATGVSPKNEKFYSAKNVLIGPGEKIAQFDFHNQSVAILGGGDNAAENYIFIKKKKPKLCHVYARTVKARSNLWNQIQPTDIFKGAYEANQKSMKITYNNQIHSYDTFIILYGWKANIPDALIPFKKELLNEKDFIIVNKQRETNIKNIFAAGEVVHDFHPCVVTSMADGITVAKSIEFNLEKQIKNK